MENLKRFFSYQKFKKSPYKLLILDQGYHLQHPTIACLNLLGHQTLALSVDPAQPAALLKKLLQTAVSFKPDAVLSFNFMGLDGGGKISSLLAELRIPLIVWFLDDFRFIIPKPQPLVYPNVLLCTFERTDVAGLRQVGFEHVLYLPTATALAENIGLKLRSNWDFLQNSVVFVGHTFLETAATWQRAGYEQYFRQLDVNDWFKGNITLDEMVKGQQGSLFATKEEFYHYLGFVSARLSHLYRMRYLQRLTALPLELFGDWQSLEGLSPKSIHGPLDPLKEAPGVFAAAGVNLNLSSAQLKTTVNLRVFDVPRAGGFLLTDWKEELARFFEPQKELAFFASPEEMEEKARFYLSHEQERRKIVQAAQKRIAAQHLLRHRLEELLTRAREVFA